MQIKTALIGLGNVNRNLLRILDQKSQRLAEDYGVKFEIVLIADSSGVAYTPDGYDAVSLISAKEKGQHVADLKGFVPGQTVVQALEHASCDLVFEASPVDLETGGPGLDIARAALSEGISVVLANKGPIVLAYQELHRLATDNKASLKYSATVCGGMPILNIATRDFIAGDILALHGVFNATSNFILDQMSQNIPYDKALAEAQAHGVAEADPSLDVEGWDSANKLLIIVNTILHANISLEDIKVTGITNITPEYLKSEKQKGNIIKLVASAEDGHYSVSPVALPASDFLSRCQGWEMGIVMHTDIYGINYYKLWEREPVSTAASMLRDAVHIFNTSGKL